MAEGANVDVDILTPEHPEWGAVTSSIATVYRKAYGANLTSFMPRLLRVAGSNGAFRVIVGMRSAAEQRLFLETYLDEPIEKAIAAKTGEAVERGCIVEIGNLAESRPGDARLGIIASTMYLYTLGYRRVVFTAVPQLLNAFKRLGIEPVEMVEARPERLPEDQRALWGSYYDERPMVCFGDIARGYAGLTDFEAAWLGAKRLADQELESLTLSNI
jgi:Thermostable hemolysin